MISIVSRLSKLLTIKLFFLSIFFLPSLGCAKGDKSFSEDANRPIQAKDKRRKNIDEGRGVSIGGFAKGMRGGTTYEFSSSNPMWRASLETLDFLPLSTVDYSGGVIITDWYSDNNASNQESIKITLRFLSNEIRSDSLKVIIHKKKCNVNQSCKINLLTQSKIKDELFSTILSKAALIEKDSKKKKKK